ncbi:MULTISPECIES: multidrug effflux MFS transporter [unclassified Achromobacter]|uniref:multidrug effflux MFS transporter n=1 Tax=unclassified Achromobacter TaxID=2626865 RepID=UPI0011786D52|nr:MULTISPECIES: multidrug effflux MFS transporter [unclassified Achromobacter]
MALTVAPMLVLTYGAGIASPTAMAQALNVNPRVSGSSSGLYGFAQMSIGAACTAFADIGSNPAVAAGCTLLGAGMLSQLAFWVASEKRETAWLLAERRRCSRSLPQPRRARCRCPRRSNPAD